MNPDRFRRRPRRRRRLILKHFRERTAQDQQVGRVRETARPRIRTTIRDVGEKPKDDWGDVICRNPPERSRGGRGSGDAQVNT